MLPKEVVLRVLAEVDSPLKLEFQLPYVTFLREVWWVTEEDAGKMDAATARSWLTNEDWWLIVDRFKDIVNEFNNCPHEAALRLGTFHEYMDFIFNGIVLALLNFFGTCWNEVWDEGWLWQGRGVLKKPEFFSC